MSKPFYAHIAAASIAALGFAWKVVISEPKEVEGYIRAIGDALRAYKGSLVLVAHVPADLDAEVFRKQLTDPCEEGEGAGSETNGRRVHRSSDGW